jgi:hypothetical protein
MYKVDVYKRQFAGNPYTGYESSFADCDVWDNQRAPFQGETVTR